ncbi:MAG: GNAT family N-acetyltransferase [Cyclobacteriaceae bacterium]
MKNTLNINIRHAVMGDLSAMHKLFVDTIRSTCQPDYHPDQIDVWTLSVENKDRWQEALTHQYFLVAEIQDTMVGFASLEQGDYLDFMYVHHDYLRKGIADRLYQALEQEATGLGKTSITSNVSKTARPFFEKKGFHVVKENKHLIRGIEITNYRMIKEL